MRKKIELEIFTTEIDRAYFGHEAAVRTTGVELFTEAELIASINIMARIAEQLATQLRELRQARAAAEAART